MHTRLRELTDIRAVAGDPSEDDLALLRSEEYGGPGLAEADVRVRSMLLAHDQYDRSYERFPKAYLDRFAETAPGKSVLPGHDKGALPLGRFFRGEVVSRREEFPTLVQGKVAEGEVEKAEQVPGFEPKHRTVKFLQAGFYYPNDEASAALDNRIKTGVYRSVSIGFRFDDLTCDVCKKSYFRDCPHIIGMEAEEGKLIVTGTYGGDAAKAEMLEGSVVFLGAQPGARLLKSMADAGEVDVVKLALTPFGEDEVALKEAEYFARRYGHKQKLWAVKAAEISPAAAGDTGEAAATLETDPAPSETATRGEKDMALLEEARKRLGLPETADEAAVLAALETTKTAADATPGVEKALAETKPYAEIGRKALADVGKQYVDHCIRLEQDEAEAKAVAELFLGRGDYDGLKSLAERKFAAVCQKYPSSPLGSVKDGQDPGNGGKSADALSGDEEKHLREQAARTGLKYEDLAAAFAATKAKRAGQSAAA